MNKPMIIFVLLVLLSGCATILRTPQVPTDSVSKRRLQKKFDADKVSCWRYIKRDYRCEPPYSDLYGQPAENLGIRRLATVLGPGGDSINIGNGLKVRSSRCQIKYLGSLVNTRRDDIVVQICREADRICGKDKPKAVLFDYLKGCMIQQFNWVNLWCCQHY